MIAANKERRIGCKHQGTVILKNLHDTRNSLVRGLIHHIERIGVDGFRVYSFIDDGTQQNVHRGVRGLVGRADFLNLGALRINRIAGFKVYLNRRSNRVARNITNGINLQSVGRKVFEQCIRLEDNFSAFGQQLH